MAWWISAISSDSFKTVAPTQTHTHMRGSERSATNCQIIRLFNVDSSLVADIILLTAALSCIMGSFLENNGMRETIGRDWLKLKGFLLFTSLAHIRVDINSKFKYFAICYMYISSFSVKLIQNNLHNTIPETQMNYFKYLVNL